MDLMSLVQSIYARVLVVVVVVVKNYRCICSFLYSFVTPCWKLADYEMCETHEKLKIIVIHIILNINHNKVGLSHGVI